MAFVSCARDVGTPVRKPPEPSYPRRLASTIEGRLKSLINWLFGENHHNREERARIFGSKMHFLTSALESESRSDQPGAPPEFTPDRVHKAMETVFNGPIRWASELPYHLATQVREPEARNIFLGSKDINGGGEKVEKRTIREGLEEGERLATESIRSAQTVRATRRER